MKTLFAIAPLLFTLAAPGFGQLADMIEMEEQGSGSASSAISDEEILQSWGWLLSERFNLKGLEVTPREVDQIAAGITAHVRGEEPPTDLSRSMLVIQEYFTKREEEIRSRQLTENRRKERDFFDQLFGLPDVQSLGSGLYYQILKPGNEVKPKVEDTVIVRYEGRFLDNTVFDSTEGGKPAAFKLGQVIDGWTQGLQLIGEGGKIKLYVPSKLGYGDEGRPSIPPASTLVFEIELLKVGLPEGTELEGEGDIDIFEPSADDFRE